MKRIILSALALSLLAVPMAEAQTQSNRAKDTRIEQRHERPAVSGYTYRKPVAKAHRFERGHRYGNWKRQQQVRDWKRHGLRQPNRGQQWVRVGNDYLLISIASGIIAGIIAGR